MADVPERCVSYVVSRSGKVLDSSGRVLESEKQVVSTAAAAGDCSEPRPIAVCEGNAENFYSLASSAVKALAPWSQAGISKKRKCRGFARPEEPKKKQRSTVTWEDEIGSLSDIVRAILWKKGGGEGRVLSVAKTSETTSSDGTDYGERSRRLEQRLRVAISQMLLLQRWEPGSREVPAKSASWLLKMLRKARPLPQALQRFLFTVSGAILPLMCCSLVCQTLTILPDTEVLRSVDILCLALYKSRACFSSFQWEILEDRIFQCQQVRLSGGTWRERGSCRSTRSLCGEGAAETFPGRGGSCSSLSHCTLSGDERSLLTFTPVDEDKRRKDQAFSARSPETAARRSSSSTPAVHSGHPEPCNMLLEQGSLVVTEDNKCAQKSSNAKPTATRAATAARAEVKERSLEMSDLHEVSLDALVGKKLQKNDYELIKPYSCSHSSLLAPSKRAYCRMHTS